MNATPYGVAFVYNLSIPGMSGYVPLCYTSNPTQVSAWGSVFLLCTSRGTVGSRSERVASVVTEQSEQRSFGYDI